MMAKSRAYTLAITIPKGGTGKTTTAANLGHYLAMSERRVLLIDCDTQAQLSAALGVEPSIGLPELTTAKGTRPQDAIFPVRENLWLLAGGRRIALLERKIEENSVRPDLILTEALEPFSSEFDVILLDTSPGWNKLLVNVLVYAQNLLIPCSLKPASLTALAQFLEQLKDVQRYNPTLNIRHVLPTVQDRRVAHSGECLNQLRGKFPPDVLCEPIRICAALADAFGFGQSIFEYNRRSNGAKDYQMLASRILGGIMDGS